MSEEHDSIRLWKHDNGIYYVVWSGGTEIKPGENRKGSKRISTGTTDRKLAEQFRAQFLAGLKNPAPPAEPTIGYLLARYRAEHGPKTRSEDTIFYHIMKLEPFFGHLFAEQVTNKLLGEYAAQSKNADGTILRQLGTLKAALKYAEGNRWIAPVPEFRMPVSKPPPRDLWLTKAQVNTLIEKARAPHLRLFILLAVSTAARSGAIMELTWSQIDLETRLINFGRGWGNKKRAIVPMNDDVRAALMVSQEMAETDYVIEYNGKPVKSIKGGFWSLCNECRITASPHVLRHTAATWLVMDGVP